MLDELNGPPRGASSAFPTAGATFWVTVAVVAAVVAFALVLAVKVGADDVEPADPADALRVIDGPGVA